MKNYIIKHVIYKTYFANGKFDEVYNHFSLEKAKATRFETRAEARRVLKHFKNNSNFIIEVA